MGAKAEPAAPVTPAAPLLASSAPSDEAKVGFEPTAAHGKLALVVLRDVISQRLSERDRCLDVVLRITVAAPDSQLRSMSIRMVVNQLLPIASVAGRIEAFATACLESVAPPVGAGSASGEAEDDASLSWARDFVRDRLSFGPPATWEEALRRTSLHAAMCTRKPALLQGFVAAFARCPPQLHPAFTRVLVRISAQQMLNLALSSTPGAWLTDAPS